MSGVALAVASTDGAAYFLRSVAAGFLITTGLSLIWRALGSDHG